MVFMINDCMIPDPAAATVEMESPRSRPYRRSLRRILCAVAVYVSAAGSTQADVVSFAHPDHHQSLAALTGSLWVHGPESIYPALGVLAAVASTYVLRRRRVAQLQAVAATEH